MSVSGQDNKRQKTRINHEIRAPKVLLIDAEGEKIGVVSISEAMNLRQKQSQESGKNYDLVEMSASSDVPVCRIMDYGKYVYQQKKKHKKPKRIQVKEVKFRPGTEEEDYRVKLRNLMRFIEHGDKVKVTVRFRGREMTHQELGMKLLERIREDIKDSVTVEQFPKLEGRQMVMMLSPKRKANGN